MKTLYILISMMLITSFILNIKFYRDLEKLEEQLKVEQSGTKFIWEKSCRLIPLDGSPILLEATVGDTIFIGPITQTFD